VRFSLANFKKSRN